MNVRIISTGSYEPNCVVTNDDLSKVVDTSDEWIRSRTGILERRIEASGSTTRMAVEAAKRALAMAEKEKGEASELAERLDLIIVATSTPDKHFPSCACEVQGALGAVHATAFDLSAACSGFLYAFNTAASYLKQGLARTALVIGADALSKALDWKDRSTCVLFGDGAGAVLLEAFETDGAAQASDLLAVKTGSDGAKGAVLECAARYHNTAAQAMPLLACNAAKTDEGAAAQPHDALYMDGQAVFRFAVRTVAANIQEVLGDLPLSEVKYFVLHQANVRIIEAAAKRLEQPMAKFPTNLERLGNTSAASIPMLLDELNRAGKLVRGDKLVLAGFGAGLTFGASLIVY